jgi:hypothetical protein
VLTPSARAMVLRCGPGVFIRSWPLAVAVTEATVTEEGRTSRVRIVDVTRLVQAAIVLGVVVCTCGPRARAFVRRENRP